MAPGGGPAVHIPVLPRETLQLLAVRPGAVVLDGTVGLAGHARLIADAIGGGGRLIGLDRDPEALERAREALASAPCRVELAHASFDECGAVLRPLGAGLLDAVLLDLGVSSLQLDEPRRGFSFRESGPLDMRMDATGPGPTAADLVAEMEEEELERIFREYGEERHAKRAAGAVVRARERSPIRTTERLAEVLAAAIPSGRDRIHPATRCFQALRIAVNDELGRLDRALETLPRWLAPGGAIGVIAFHSLEDRRVKRAFLDAEKKSILKRRTKKAVRPTEEEMAGNPRARSARLRVAERV